MAFYVSGYLQLPATTNKAMQLLFVLLGLVHYKALHEEDLEI